MTTLASIAEKRHASTTGVRRWTWFTLAFFILVVLDGAVVRATGSGAGCGDHWPLCNGQVIPQHPRLATMIEFGHRASTGTATAFFAVMIAWTFFATMRRHPARRSAAWAGVLLITEAFLGFVLVHWHLVEKNASTARVLAQAVHFTNTMLLLAATALTAVFLRSQRTEPAPERSFRTAGIAALMITILTGATGSLAALADTIYPSSNLAQALHEDFAVGAPALVHMRWLHPASALALTICCIALIASEWRRGRQHVALGLGANLIAQIVIGALDVLLLAPTWLQILHLLSADIFWITLVAIIAPAVFRRSFHRLKDPAFSLAK